MKSTKLGILSDLLKQYEQRKEIEKSYQVPTPQEWNSISFMSFTLKVKVAIND